MVLPPETAGPVYIEIKLQMTWTEFCTHEPTFCLELVDIVRQVVVFLSAIVGGGGTVVVVAVVVVVVVVGGGWWCCCRWH